MKPKRAASLLAAALTLAAFLVPKPANADSGIHVLLDQQPLSFDVAPRIVAGRTLVPFRAIANALGAAVAYDPATRGITATGLGHEVHLTVDQTEASVDGVPTMLDVPAQVQDGRTLVPLRFFAAAFGAGVSYEAATQTALLTSPTWQPTTLAFYAIHSFDERNLIPRFNVIAFGWSTLTAQGAVDFTTGPDYKWPQAAGAITPEALLQGAATLGTKRLLMVQMTDRTGDLTHLVTTPALRTTAATNLASAAAARGFEGIELDLEGLGLSETGDTLAAIQQGFSDLVRQAAARLHADGRTLVVSAPPPNGAYHGYDLREIGRRADLIELMAHDYRQDGQPEPSDRVSEAINQTLAQVPPYKVLLGINLPVETADSVAGKVALARQAYLKGVAFWRLGLMGPDRLASLQAQGVLRP